MPRQKLRNQPTVPTPKGEPTGSRPIDGFQIVRLEDFLANESIPRAVKLTHHPLYFDLIWYCTEGHGTHHVDFQRYSFEAPCLFVIKNGQYHAWNMDPGLRGYMIFFTSGFSMKLGDAINSLLINDYVGDLTFPYLSIGDPAAGDVLEALMRAMLSEYGLLRDENKVLRSYLQAFLAKVEFEYTRKYPEILAYFRNSTFASFQQLLKEKVGESRNATYFCELLGVRFGELNKLSKDISGFTLKEYIDQYLVTVAKRSLSSGRQSISQVAYELGFDEVSHFSKYFKRLTGLVPTEFMRHQSSY